MARQTKFLVSAKKNKNDEFYTSRVDIEDELRHYEKQFEGKTVYCNCDDPVTSEFWQFFRRNFRPWKIKRLIATHYEPDAKNFAYSLDLSEDTNCDGIVDWNDEPVLTQLPCNGDFRSAACIDLLKQADIVVTNPPFSLFREYVQQLIDYDKKFLIIGNVNAISYKEFFPLLMENKVWIGYRMNRRLNGNVMMFKVPDDYPDTGTEIIMEDGVRYIGVPGNGWFTNLDVSNRHDFIDLRGNYYKAALYPKYDNYNAIEVSKVDEIPCDYDGVMGVPITFMSKYCPDQFEILGLSQKCGFGLESTKFYDDYKEVRQDGSLTGSKGKKMNGNPVMAGKPNKGNYYVDDENNYAYSLYARIFIKHRNPEPRRYPDED